MVKVKAGKRPEDKMTIDKLTFRFGLIGNVDFSVLSRSHQSSDGGDKYKLIQPHVSLKVNNRYVYFHLTGPGLASVSGQLSAAHVGFKKVVLVPTTLLLRPGD